MRSISRRNRALAELRGVDPGAAQIGKIGAAMVDAVTGAAARGEARRHQALRGTEVAAERIGEIARREAVDQRRHGVRIAAELGQDLGSRRAAAIEVRIGMAGQLVAALMRLAHLAELGDRSDIAVAAGQPEGGVIGAAHPVFFEDCAAGRQRRFREVVEAERHRAAVIGDVGGTDAPEPPHPACEVARDRTSHFHVLRKRALLRNSSPVSI